MKIMIMLMKGADMKGQRLYDSMYMKCPDSKQIMRQKVVQRLLQAWAVGRNEVWCYWVET